MSNEIVDLQNTIMPSLEEQLLMSKEIIVWSYASLSPDGVLLQRVVDELFVRELIKSNFVITLKWNKLA